jgi:hypothetical protein
MSTPLAASPKADPRAYTHHIPEFGRRLEMYRSRPRSVPLLEPGSLKGEHQHKPDCARYEDCLARYIREFPELASNSTQCPRGCEYLRPRNRHDEHMFATVERGTHPMEMLIAAGGCE